MRMTITVPTRVAVLFSAAAAVLALGAAYLVGEAQASGPAALASQQTSAADAKQPGITVSGLGRVTGTPDVLNVRLRVEVRRDDIDSALSAANSTLARMRDSLRKNGVAADDMQTSGLSIQPTYTNKGAVNGYQVSESLDAKLRNLVRAGKTIVAAVGVGGNAVRIDSISFDLERDTKLVAAARSAAFAEAKAKAAAYAKAAGRDLGSVTSISEVVTQPPNPYADQLRSYATAPGAAFKDVPIEPGTQDVTVTVNVLWSLR